jgi:hypothetical protein
MKIRQSFVSNSSSSSFVMLVDRENDTVKTLVDFCDDLSDSYDDFRMKCFQNKEEWVDYQVEDNYYDRNNSEDMAELEDQKIAGLFTSFPDKVVFDVKIPYSCDSGLRELLNVLCQLLNINFFRLNN